MIDRALKLLGDVLRHATLAQFIGQSANCLTQFRLKQIEQAVEQQCNDRQTSEKPETDSDQRLAFIHSPGNILCRSLMLVPPVRLQCFQCGDGPGIIHLDQAVGSQRRPVLPGSLLSNWQFGAIQCDRVFNGLEMAQFRRRGATLAVLVDRVAKVLKLPGQAVEIALVLAQNIVLEVMDYAAITKVTPDAAEQRSATFSFCSKGLPALADVLKPLLRLAAEINAGQHCGGQQQSGAET